MTDFRIDTPDMTLIITCAGGMPPALLYWGKRLGPETSADDVARMQMQQGGPGGVDCPVAPSLALEPGIGLLGPSGFLAHRNGRDWGSRFDVERVEASAYQASIFCRDARAELRLDYQFDVDPETGVLTLGCSLTNDGAEVIDVNEMATACLPIPQAMTDLIGFTGRWGYEFQRERITRFSGGYIRENRRGRSSHDSFPALILCEATTNESSGEAYGLHLAWSGNHRLRVDTLGDGSVLASLGALFFPGEIRLGAGECYESPAIVAGYSPAGLSALSQKFHKHVRKNLLRPSTRARPRPVHYNTWEAVYFDHDLDRLKAIATRAAAIGVERFVLDDGWFGSRRDDQSGLGDWYVSDAVYPDGLKPLIDHVTGLGMEMGIWFEPEMVNPNSDLFRAHPDWVLHIEGVDQLPFRNQYVLDIARSEVSDYLFERIDAILTDHPIGYIKWDMNRDLNHPGGVDGRPRARAQVDALYALIDRIRLAHPTVEIESCASGGGRADYGILAHTDRIWTSDTNDAIDRQNIQRGASFFLPLEVIGAHIGPRHCHITGRTLPMAMRAGTAMIGHMGLELNLATEPEAELQELKGAIVLYKRYRALLHSGDFYRLDTPSHLNAVGVVSVDHNAALWSVAWIANHAATRPGSLVLRGLDPLKRYRVRLVWPHDFHSVSSPSVVDVLDLTDDGYLLSGGALMTIGLQLPLVRPETLLLFDLVSEVSAND
jgi:alpha-galactosidase